MITDQCVIWCSATIRPIYRNQIQMPRMARHRQIVFLAQGDAAGFGLAAFAAGGLEVDEVAHVVERFS